MEPKHPLTKEEIINIQTLKDGGYNIPQIQQSTGYSTSTIDKYIKQPRIQPIDTAEPVNTVENIPQEESPLIPLVEDTTPMQPVPVQTQTQQPIQQQYTRQPEYARPVEQPATRVHLQETPIPQPAVVLPTSGIVEPHEWLKTFLEQYAPPLKTGFIKLISDRAKMRKDLPTGAQLTDDIQAMESGVNKLHHAAYIAEIYEHELRNYIGRREREENYYKQPYRGIGPKDRGGYTPRYDSVSANPYDRPARTREPYGHPYDGIRQPDPYYYQPPPRQDEHMGRLEHKIEMMEDERRRKQEEEMLALKMQIQSGGQQDPTMARLEQKIEMLEADRLHKQEEEMRAIKMQLQQGTGLREQDVMRIIETNTPKLKPDDVRRIIGETIGNKQSLSEIDLKYKELQDKHKLEVMKLDEKGKTRDTIADAVKGGFSQVGAAIARTAAEVGTEDKRQMEGTTDGKNMWQAECPYCSELITAPLSAKIIQCPGCNRRLEVSQETAEKPAQTFMPPVIENKPQEQPYNLKPKEETEIEPEIAWPEQRQFPVAPLESQAQPQSVEQPKQIIADIGYNAQCPSCGTSMKIPLGAKRVACPRCGKQLEVGEPIEEDKHMMPVEKEISLPMDSNPIPIPILDEKKVNGDMNDTVPEIYSGVEGGEKIEYKEVAIDELKKMEEQVEPEPKQDAKEQIIETQAELIAETEAELKAEAELNLPPAEAEKAFYETAKEHAITEGTGTGPEIKVEADDILDVEQKEEPKFVCEFCGRDDFKTKQSLNGHRLHHLKAKKQKEKKKGKKT